MTILDMSGDRPAKRPSSYASGGGGDDGDQLAKRVRGIGLGGS